jgi:hypothetical protein
MKRYILWIVIPVIILFTGLHTIFYTPVPKFIVPEKPKIIFDFVTTKKDHSFIVKLNGRWGVLDSQCHWTVPPQFKNIDYYSTEFIGVTYDGKRWGYIDSSGKQIVPCIVSQISYFIDGYTKVIIDKKPAFIDHKGHIYPLPDGMEYGDKIGDGLILFFDKIKIPSFMPSPGMMRPGMAGPGMMGPGIWPVSRPASMPVIKYGFMNLKGKIVIPRQYENAHEFSEGLAAVQVNKKWGFIDTTGKMIIEPRWDSAGHFNHGIASVRSGLKYGIIDKTGRVIIEPKWNYILQYPGELACVKSGDKYGIIDKTGKLIVPPIYDELIYGGESDYFYGGILAALKDGKWGFLDRTGKVAIDFKYDMIGYGIICFPEGLQAVCVGNKWGFIDRKGKWIIEPKYDMANEFSDGLAAVEMGRIEKRKINFEYFGEIINDGFSPRTSLFERERIPGKFGFIDKTGKMIIPPQYDSVGYFYDGKCSVTYQDRSWIIDKTGKPIDIDSPLLSLP